MRQLTAGQLTEVEEGDLAATHAQRTFRGGTNLSVCIAIRHPRTADALKLSVLLVLMAQGHRC
jgi:hypothetical protein